MKYWLAPQLRCENDDDGNDQPSGEKKNRASSGEITAVRDSEMNCNVYRHIVEADLIATWHDAGLR
jgi:hypothetical protein